MKGAHFTGAQFRPREGIAGLPNIIAGLGPAIQGNRQ